MQRQAPPVKSVALRLAGSGSNVSLLRRTIAACAQSGPALDVHIAEGIGSGGGLRALRDGVIDVALVSRPLKPTEHDPSWHVVTYARSAVGWAAHPLAPLASLTEDQLLAALQQPRPRWPDGQPMQWLLREAGDSSHATAAAWWPRFKALEARARQRADAQTFYHDRTMHAALWSTPGAVGLVDISAVQAEGLPLPLVALAGTTATPEAIAAGRWPLVKPLALVYPQQLAPRVEPVLRCLGSAVGRTALAQGAALPQLEAP